MSKTPLNIFLGLINVLPLYFCFRYPLIYFHLFFLLVLLLSIRFAVCTNVFFYAVLIFPFSLFAYTPIYCFFEGLAGSNYADFMTYLLIAAYNTFAGILIFKSSNFKILISLKTVFVFLSFGVFYFTFKELIRFSDIFKFFYLYSISYALNTFVDGKPIRLQPKKIVIIAIIVGIILPFISLLKPNQNEKILIGQCFTVWAKASKQYDLSDWTLKSNYSYSLFIKELSANHKTSVLKNRNDLYKALKQNEVFILNMPTVPLKNKEIKEIVNFVKSGNRLIIITDHTDLYGHGRVANKILSEFNLSVRYDALFKADRNSGTIYFGNYLERSQSLMTANSIATLIPSYVFGWAHNYLSENPNYTRPNFFGSLSWTADDIKSTYPVCSFTQYGKGSITIWCDSTVFSNFAIYQPYVLTSMMVMLNWATILSLLPIFYLFMVSLVLIYLLVIIIAKKPAKLVLYCLVLMAMCFSGFYFVFGIGPFIKNTGKEQLDVYCKPEIINEIRQGPLQINNKYSFLFSNLARFGIRPIWRGICPPKSSGQKILWLVDSSDYEPFMHENNKNIYVIFTNVPYGKINFKLTPYTLKLAKNHFIPVYNQENRTIYLNKDKKLNGKAYDMNIFCGTNVVTDNVLGDWWSSIDVSPYKKETLKMITNWIKYGDSISAYIYPESLKLGESCNGYLLIPGEANKISITTQKPHIYDNKYTYIGGGVWGIVEEYENQIIIYGGPETSDDYIPGKEVRWLIKLIKTPECQSIFINN